MNKSTTRKTKSNLLFEGVIKLDTPIIDPSLPRNCQKRWAATGLLIHDSLRHSYLDMVSEATEDSCVPINEAYLILAGRLPVVRNKRTEIGRNHLLSKHNNALGLFGSLAHGVEGRLKVGFLAVADSEGNSAHTMRIINSSKDDLEMMVAIINQWSKACFLGEQSGVGFGSIMGDWQVIEDGVNIGYISLKQGVMDTNISI